MRFLPALITSIILGLLITWVIYSTLNPGANPLLELEEMVEEAERADRTVVQEVMPESVEQEIEEIEEVAVEEDIVIEEVVLPPLPTPDSFSGPEDFLVFFPLDGEIKDLSSRRLGGYLSKGTYSYDRHGSDRGAYYSNNAIGFIRIESRLIFSQIGTYSFSAWIKPSLFNIHNTIISQVTPGRDFNLKLMKNGAFQAHLARGAAYQFCTTDETLVLDKWTHVAATADTKEWKLYINGKLKKTCPIKFLPHGNSSTFQIGSMGTRENFSGAIDDVIVYDRTLSAAEISSLVR